MIGKVTKAGRGFGGLVSYLIHGAKKQEPATRVAWSATRNLGVDDPAVVPKLMAATASRSKRVKAPVYHYVISWAPNDTPTDEVMQKVADATSEDLGLQEHQMLFVAHDDTKHRHVHIVVNRVHPETGTAWKPSHDYRRIEISLRRQAEAMGMPFVEGRHNSKKYDQTKSRKPKSNDLRRGERTGEQARQRMSRQQVEETAQALGTLFSMSTSWGGLAYGLRMRGFGLQRKGQGLVITNGLDEMKLSSLGKEIRLKALHERFRETYAEFAERCPALNNDPVAEPERLDAPVIIHKPAPSPSAPVPPRPILPSSKSSWNNEKSQPSARDAAFEALRQATDVADLTVQLHALGLTSEQHVKRTVQEIKTAHEAVLATKPVLDQLLDGLAAKLESRKEPTLAPAPRTDKQPNKRKNRDRGRGR